MGRLILNAKEFKEALTVLRSHSGGFVVDTETFHLNPYRKDSPSRICSIQIGPAEDLSSDRDYCFAFRHAEGPNLAEWFLEPLRQLLRGRTLTGHNLKFDVHHLLCDGFELPPVMLDSMIASHLANELEPTFSLKPLSVKYLGQEEVTEDEELQKELKKRKLGKGGISRLSAALVAPYALADIRLTKRLHANRYQELDRWGLTKLYAERCEFYRELTKTERQGIKLSREAVARQQAKIEPLLAERKAELDAMSGGVNLNSPKQLCEWLKVPSTAREFLTDLLQKEPRADIRALLEYRDLFKANSAFFEPLLELADAEDRIHVSYRITGTKTHRLSCSEPNVQQSGRDQQDRLYSVRSCYVADPNTFFLEVDFAAQEPRLAAHYSQDPGMIELFRQGHDFHSAIAKSMYRKEVITKDERTSAKTLGLGLLYGLGSYKSAVKLGLRHRKNADGSWCECHQPCWAMSPEGELTEYPCSVISAEYCTAAGKEYAMKYYGAAPELKPCMDRVRATAARNLYIRIPVTGAVQRFDWQLRDPYKSFNALIQCTAAEILRRAFTKLSQMFSGPDDPKLMLTVHDSIVFQILQNDRAPEFVRTIKDVMENTTQLTVPLPVDMKVGYDWSNMGAVQI